MAVHQELRAFFETTYPLHKEGLKELFSAFQEQSYAKGSMLHRGGEEETHLRFMVSGVIRDFYAADGKETNTTFYTEPQFVSDLAAFMEGRPTRKWQEALADVTILSINRERFLALLDKYQCGKDFITLSFRNILKQKELMEYNRSTKSADKLYEELMIYKPQWLQKVPQYHIASYLNITPETLSRIRKRT